MDLLERVRDLILPIAQENSVDLFDVEHAGGVLRITIDRAGGVGIDEISAVTRAFSRALDAADPIPGRYTLEVSSPGLERTLRTPLHFQGAIGSIVNLKTKPDVEGERRVKALVVSADEHGIVLRDPNGRDSDSPDADGSGADGTADRALRYDEIDKARTVFDWTPAPKPGSSRRAGGPEQHQRKRKKASSR